MIVAVSGYFSPLHVGHLKLLEATRDLCSVPESYLVVIVNSDYQARLKGSMPFMNEKDRAKIVSSLWMVDSAILSIDKDGSVCKTLERLQPDIFANGGDRTRSNIPEVKTCKKLGIKMLFGIGGKKIRSSSKILAKARR